MFTNDIKNIETKVVSDNNISDHNNIEININNKINRNIVNNNNKIKRYFKYDKEKFVDIIKTKNLRAYHDLSVNKLGTCIEEVLSTCAKKCMIEKQSVRNRKCNWLNNNILKSKDEKNQAYMKAVISGEDNSWTEYKNIRNIYVNKLRQAKNNYFQYQL